jgi:hypothetical protein
MRLSSVFHETIQHSPYGIVPLRLTIKTSYFRFIVSVHAPNKAAVNSPVKSSAPTGPARSVLPVHDQPARGLKPLLRDYLAAVETKGQYAGEHLRFIFDIDDA